MNGISQIEFKRNQKKAEETRRNQKKATLLPTDIVGDAKLAVMSVRLLDRFPTTEAGAAEAESEAESEAEVAGAELAFFLLTVETFGGTAVTDFDDDDDDDEVEEEEL